jgi:hypothetical protein
MANPRPTIYKGASKDMPKKEPTEKDQRLWQKNKARRGIKK